MSPAPRPLYDRIIHCDDILISDPLRPEKIQRFSGSIAVLNEKIVAIEKKLDHTAKETIDYRGKTILPGLIDSQVHFRDPGAPQKEDFESGTRGAVFGGITAVFDMPNTSPSTATQEAFQEKMATVGPKAHCDFGLFVGATAENVAELKNLERLPGCCGVKIFMGASTGNLLVAEDETLKKALASGQRRVAVHCEDNQLLTKRKPIAVEAKHPKAHPIWRNIETARKATERIVKLAHQTGRPVHTLHITTEEELEFLKDQKEIATVECLPQHLFFSSPDCYEKLGSKAQMNPPIRERRHQEALWKAIDEDLVHVIGSDHAPHTLEEKQKEYPSSPSGMPGVQTMIPLLLNFVNQSKLSLEKLACLTSIHPAKIYGAQGKGGIYVGQDADFTVVDLDKERTIEDSWIKSRCGWTPYHGVTVKGWPVATIIRGQTIMENDELLVEKSGQPINFKSFTDS